MPRTSCIASGSPTRVSTSSSTPLSITGTPAISTRTSVIVWPRNCCGCRCRPHQATSSGQAISRRTSASERVPLSDFEGVGPVLVLRQDPRQRFALVELEQDDLIARRRRQAARVGQEDAVRDALADRDARARIQAQARRLLIRIAGPRSGVIWNVSTPKVCSTTRPTSCDSAPVRARVARASTSRCCAFVRAAAARPARCRRSAPGR